MNLFKTYSAGKCVENIFVKYSVCVEEKKKGGGGVNDEQYFTEVMIKHFKITST